VKTTWKKHPECSIRPFCVFYCIEVSINCVACGVQCVLFPSNYWLPQEKSSKCRWFVLFIEKKSLFCLSLPREKEEVVAICSRNKGISDFYFFPEECRVLMQTKRTQVSVRNNARCGFFSTSELFVTFQYLQPEIEPVLATGRSGPVRSRSRFQTRDRSVNF
jgi:hypothetical protein